MCNDSLECKHDDNGGKVDESQSRMNFKHVDETRDMYESNKNSDDAKKTGIGNEMDETEVNHGNNTQTAGKEGIKVSYANIASSNSFDNKLNLIPTETNEDGVEVVIFDEEIVSAGSKKWELTVCGYLIGYKCPIMSLDTIYSECGGKFGLKSIIPNGNGVFLFKFRSNKGIQSFIEMRPCMVNGKPMFVQKWDPSVSLDKVEPNKLPLWVKLRNLPLEAWTTKGISVVASRLGTPLIMDQATTNMCKISYGKVGFARVLIDVEAEKGLPDKTKIVYKNIDGLVTCKKSVDVNYDWSPPICSFCKVFGHCDKNCVCRPKSVEGFMDMEREDGKDGTKAGDNKRNKVEKEKMIDKGSPKTGWNLFTNRIVVEREVIDVYDDTTGSTRKMAQNDIGSSYVEVLNGMGRGVLETQKVSVTSKL
ncbi:RNA-directed DNA polymerase, eukaryota, reverse transcriptase zinc-binding domain protein [Tanacetum coccineum]